MRFSVAVGFVLLCAAPAHAEVVATAENGFVIRQAAEVTAGPDEVWSQLLKPGAWWSDKHSYSGDSANLTIDPRGGGCFCEVLPSAVSPRAAPRGSVEHMRVVYAESPRVLRMSGALGPMQSEAVQGTLTVALKPVDGGTRIMWEYVVGGYMRQKIDLMAPVVDSVLGEQLSQLAAKLGPRASTAPPEAEAKPRAAPLPAPVPAKPKRPVEGR